MKCILPHVMLLSIATSTLTFFANPLSKRSLDSSLEKRDDSCAAQCTDCPEGRFVITTGKFNSGYFDYMCFGCTDDHQTCTPLPACDPVPNAPAPVGTPADGVTVAPPPSATKTPDWCAQYCVDCTDGLYYSQVGELAGAVNGVTYFSCAEGCGGTIGEGNCVPPIPSTCPIPLTTVTHGWCGIHITQYQKQVAGSGGKNAGDPYFMFDVEIYDAAQMPLGSVGNIILNTGQTYTFTLPLLQYPFSITAGAFDTSPVDLEYNGNSWNTGTNDQNGNNPNFSEDGVYASPYGSKPDTEGQREIDSGFTC